MLAVEIAEVQKNQLTSTEILNFLFHSLIDQVLIFDWCKRKQMYLLQDIVFTELGFAKHA